MGGLLFYPHYHLCCGDFIPVCHETKPCALPHRIIVLHGCCLLQYPSATPPVTLATVLSRLLLFQSVAGPKSLEALQEFQELPRRCKHFAGTEKGWSWVSIGLMNFGTRVWGDPTRWTWKGRMLRSTPSQIRCFEQCKMHVKETWAYVVYHWIFSWGCSSSYHWIIYVPA